MAVEIFSQPNFYKSIVTDAWFSASQAASLSTELSHPVNVITLVNNIRNKDLLL